MTEDEIVQLLEENKEVLESYVLVREIKAFLKVGHDHFHPEIKIRIYKSGLNSSSPYHFDVSHYVKTPDQAGTYTPSRISESTERLAIERAISTTTTFLRNAIRNGHEPSDEWLVPNEDF